MAQIKNTKIELAAQVKKRALYMTYLPMLNLKKMLLQTQVIKASAEIKAAQEKFEKEYEIVLQHAALLTDPAADAVREQVQIERVEISTDNIAGIEVPTLKHVVFVKVDVSLLVQPIWVDDLVSMIKTLKRAYQMVEVAKQKKKVLEKELRIVSIRVNLFDKRLIPDATRIIRGIKIALADIELHAVATAKISKNKILKKAELELV